MKDWFNGLEKREKLYLIIGSVVCVLTLYYLLVLEPLVKSKHQAISKHANTVELLQYMKSSEQEVKRLRQQLATQIPKVAKEKLLGVVDQGLRTAGIDKDLKSISPEPDEGVRLRFDEVDFNKLITWLGNASNQHGIQVDQITVTDTAEPGVVKAGLLIK